MTRDEESSQSEKDMDQDVGESASSYLDTTIQQFTSDLLQNIEFEDRHGTINNLMCYYVKQYLL